MNTDTRAERDLNGTWTLAFDPGDAGAAADWHSPEAAWPEERTTRVEVPHAWQELDDSRDYTGVAWYRRPVTVGDPADGRRRFLHFGAVDYEATVWVNGVEVGHHADGYLPFECEVTDVLTAGENTVVVRVEDPGDVAEIPHGKQADGWYTRVSGIWQSVSLRARPETYVADSQVTPDLETDTAVVDIDVAGTAAAGELTAEVVVERDGEIAGQATAAVSEAEALCEVSLPDPDYWSPADPALYDLTVRLRDDGEEVDEYTDYFGMRSVSTDGDRLYLNGEPLYVRGALDQAYYPHTLYRPFRPDLFEDEIRLAKEMGFNLLRKHIKPAHPDFVEAADRLGILVWEEPANPTVYTERSKRELAAQYRGLVERDYNRPSVVVWSIYNEEWGIGLDQADYSMHEERLWNDGEKQEYLTELFHELRELDPTRPVCDNSGWAHVATDLNDYHEYFVSPDRAGAWADRLDDIVANPADNYAVENTPAGDAPILISEFGTWGLSDVEALREHYDGDPPWFHHDFLDHPLKHPNDVDESFAATDLPEVVGDLGGLADVWQAREFASIADVIAEMRVRDGIAGYCITEFSDIEWEFNGMLDYFREPKSFVEDLASVNGERIAVIQPSAHVLEPGETVEATVSVVNDTGEPFEATVSWEGLAAAETRSVAVEGFGTTTVPESLPVTAPADAETGPREVTVTVETPDGRFAATESVAVVAPEDPPAVAVYADDPLDGRLADAGVDVVADLATADVAVVQRVDDEVREFVRAGNAAVLVPGTDGRMADDAGPFEFRQLPDGESWNLVASLLYQDSPLLSDLCVDECVGWAFEDVFPYDMVADPDADADRLHAGSVEGWLANWSSPLIERDLGEGTVHACTFRVTDAYGEHPTATLLLDRLLADR